MTIFPKLVFTHFLVILSIDVTCLGSKDRLGSSVSQGVIDEIFWASRTHRTLPIFPGLDKLKYLEYLFNEVAKKVDSCQSGSMPVDKDREFLDAHNNYRRQEQAANMEHLSWNSMLAQQARKLAERCLFSHDVTGTHYFKGRILGQNVYVSTGKRINSYDVVTKWYSEKRNYDQQTGRCRRSDCSHYTQVVWATTREIGCAMVRCHVLRDHVNGDKLNADIAICNYAPAGNVHMEKPETMPFEYGEPCTACRGGHFFCNKGLCDSSCTHSAPNCECHLKCHSNAWPSFDECTCRCKPGYSGVDCADPCVDRDVRCNPRDGEMGWLPVMCSHPDHSTLVTNACPLMCKTCVPMEEASDEVQSDTCC